MIDYDFWGIILAVLAIVAPTLLFFSKLDRSLQGLTELIRDFHKSHSVEHRDLTMFLRSEFDKTYTRFDKAEEQHDVLRERQLEFSTEIRSKKDAGK